MKKLLGKKFIGNALLVCFGLYAASFLWVSLRPGPAGTSVAFPWRSGEARFLKDASGPQGEKEIINAQLALIAQADEYIIMDAFLYNNQRGKDAAPYPSISRQLTEALIRQKQRQPELTVLVITDPINGFYGSYPSEELVLLQEAGITTVETELPQLRDPNPLWSALWRPLFSWTGNGQGWLDNPIAALAPKVTLRSYLELFNLKANHRKTITTEDGSVVSSANPHDASYPNGNSGVFLRGETARDIALAEITVAKFSGLSQEASQALEQRIVSQTSAGDIQSRFLVDGAIAKAAGAMIRECQPGDRLDLAMFYLSDEAIITALTEAAQRGVEVRVILDKNIAAFGREKGTIPNSATAARLMDGSEGKIALHWANDSHGEQFHHKALLTQRGDTVTLLIGSANYTRRNLNNYNLEADLQLKGQSTDEFAIAAAAWFADEWAHNSAPWQKKDTPGLALSVLSRFQEFSGLCSF